MSMTLSNKSSPDLFTIKALFGKGESNNRGPFQGT